MTVDAEQGKGSTSEPVISNFYYVLILNINHALSSSLPKWNRKTNINFGVWNAGDGEQEQMINQGRLVSLVTNGHCITWLINLTFPLLKCWGAQMCPVKDADRHRLIGHIKGFLVPQLKTGYVFG